MRIAAADAWTQIAREGRLGPALAAEAIELGVTRGALKLSRIQASTVSGMPELPAPVAALARSKGTSKLAEAARRLARLG